MILQDKIGVLYKYTRNETTKVSDYSDIWISIPCNIQPTTTNDGLDGGAMYNTSKLYTDYEDITVGDKIVVLWRTFIVKEIQRWNWLRRKYIKALINESNGN